MDNNNLLLKLAFVTLPPDAALAETAAFTDKSGWSHLHSLPADAENGMEVVWRSADLRVDLHFVQDDIAGQAYLALRGAPDAVVAAAIDVRAALPVITLDEALRRERIINPSSADLAALPGLLAVLGPPKYDAAVMHALADLLQADDANVRLRTLVAMACLGWLELRPLANAVAAADSEDFVRWRAADLLLSYDKVSQRRS
jgi:hypothetical protein